MATEQTTTKPFGALRPQTHWRWVAVAALVVFVGTRLALIWRFPPYWDECYYAILSHRALVDPAHRFDSLLDDKGPLFTWLSIVPIGLGINPLTAVRLVSAVAGLVALGAVGALARWIDGARSAAIAMMLFALIPFFLVQGAMGIYEPLVTGLAMLALFAQIRLAERPGWPLALLLGLTLGAGLLTKETGKIAVVLLPLSLLAFDFGRPGLFARLTRWILFVLLALGVMYLAYAVLRLSPLYYQLGGIRRRLGLYTSPGAAISHPGPSFQLNWPSFRVMLAAYLTIPLLALAAASLPFGIARHGRRAVLLAVWFVVPLGAAVLIANRPIGRYLLNALPPLIVLMAATARAAIDVLVARLSGVRERCTALTVTAVIAVVPALVFDVRLIADPERMRLPAFDDRELIAGWPSGTGWRGVADLIRAAHPAPDTLIAFGGHFSLALPLLLDDPGEKHVRFARVDQPGVSVARFVVLNDLALPPPCPLDGGRLPPASTLRDGIGYANAASPPDCSFIQPRSIRLIHRFPRARGPAVSLYALGSPNGR